LHCNVVIFCKARVKARKGRGEILFGVNWCNSIDYVANMEIHTGRKHAAISESHSGPRTMP